MLVVRSHDHYLVIVAANGLARVQERTDRLKAGLIHNYLRFEVGNHWVVNFLYVGARQIFLARLTLAVLADGASLVGGLSVDGCQEQE